MGLFCGVMRGAKRVRRVLSVPVSSYTLSDAARILKVSPARLRYWSRTHLLWGEDPAGSEETTAQTAVARRLHFSDLVAMRGVLSLLEKGISLQQIRRELARLRTEHPELEAPLNSLRLSKTGLRRLVVRAGTAWVEPGGQGVFDLDPAAEAIDSVASLTAAQSARALDDDAEALFSRGCSLDADPATYAEAIECYRRAVEVDPDFADCHCNLGAVYYNGGDRSLAQKSFVRCLEIEPHHVEANFNLANLLEEEGDDHGALRHYKLALAAAPLYADLQINLALLYEKLGENGRARRHWRRYLQLDSAGTWSELARLRLAPAEE